jgi:hypothetical protein
MKDRQYGQQIGSAHMVNDYVNILSGEAICLTLLKERRETVET